jgi:hypothetical protein
LFQIAHRPIDLILLKQPVAVAVVGVVDDTGRALDPLLVDDPAEAVQADVLVAAVAAAELDRRHAVSVERPFDHGAKLAFPIRAPEL